MYVFRAAVTLGVLLLVGLPLLCQETAAPATPPAPSASATQEQAPQAQNQTPEELRLNAYLETFNTVDLAGKIQLLEAAANDPIDQVVPVYGLAARYLVDNAQALPLDTELQLMVRLVLPRIQESGVSAYNSLLWQIFLAHDDILQRQVILANLAPVAVDDPQTRLNIASFLQAQLRRKQTGETISVQLALALVDALGKMNNAEFRPVLVETVIAQIDANITALAYEILGTLGEMPQAFGEVFRLAQGADKLDIYVAFVESEDVTTEDKVAFAQIVLNNILSTSIRDAETARVFIDIRVSAVRILSANNRPEFAPILVRHFNDAIVGYDRGTIERLVVIEAIAALGTTTSPVAAQRLTEFLNLINSYTQQDRPYDRQITLNTIENLRILQNVQSYNALFMVTILNYPVPLKDAAREALSAIAR